VRREKKSLRRLFAEDGRSNRRLGPDYCPAAVHITLGARLKQMEPEDPETLINYRKELGLKPGQRGREWPKALQIDRQKGDTGQLKHLLEATRWAEWELESPGVRVLGRKKIAQVLGIREYQLTENWRTQTAYKTAITKVGWLMVSELQRLMDLADRRWWHLYHVRQTRKPTARG
jgi:hypothetical protein